MAVSARPEQEPIAKFILRYRKPTGRTYRSGILDFFDFLNDGERMRGKAVTPKDMVIYEKYAVKFLKETRDYQTDLVSYVKHLDETGVAPKSAHTRIIGVKEFLSFNNIELDKGTLKDVKRLHPRGGVRTDFQYVDKKILGEILHHLDARGTAFVLVAASSGARLGEILSLTWSNIKIPDRQKYPDKPASLFIRTSKTGNSRTTYITRECEAALDEWQKVYSGYRDFATKRSENLGKPELEKKNGDNRVFPFTKTSVYHLWNDALAKAGYYNMDEGTQRVQMNIHRLRNFFSVQVASASNTQVSEYLLGHTDQYDGAYTGRSQEQWERDYAKAEAALTIGSTTRVTEKHSEEIKRLREENDALKAKLESTTTATGGEMDAMKKQLDELSKLVYTLNNERRDNLTPSARRQEDEMIEEGAKIAHNLLKK
jgi:integrase